jgi:hypothetical protein
MRILAFAFLLFVSGITKAQNNVSFIEEYIDFALTKQSFIINGIFVFTNMSEKEVQRKIVFPFGSEVDSAYAIRVYDLSSQKKINYKKVFNGISFDIDIDSGDTIKINIAYNLKLKKENCYILCSTQSWKHPLNHAKYTLCVKDDLEIDSFSFTPDSKNDSVYFWEKTNFMPDSNFLITIK